MIEDSHGEFVGSVRPKYLPRIVAAVNGEAIAREGISAAHINWKQEHVRVAALEARVKEAERLLDRAEDAVRPGGLRNSIRAFLAKRSAAK